MAKILNIMKLKPVNSTIVFFLASVLYLILVFLTLTIFATKTDGGFFTDLDVILYTIVYQIPISLITSSIYYYIVKKKLTFKPRVWSLIQMNLPILWFPVTVSNLLVIYWIIKGMLVEVQPGIWEENENID